eukprot:173015-Pyramimonas_sp.AAC.1
MPPSYGDPARYLLHSSFDDWGVGTRCFLLRAPPQRAASRNKKKQTMHLRKTPKAVGLMNVMFESSPSLSKFTSSQLTKGGANVLHLLVLWEENRLVLQNACVPLALIPQPLPSLSAQPCQLATSLTKTNGLRVFGATSLAEESLRARPR